MEVMKNVPEKCRERRIHFLHVFMIYGLLPFIAVSAISVLAVSCEELDNDIDRHSGADKDSLSSSVSLGRVATLLAELPIGEEQLSEVYDAVTSSSENGYDEEYMMCDLFRLPGAGVGDDRLPSGTKSPAAYSLPMRELIIGHLEAAAGSDTGTKSCHAKGLSSGYGTVLSPEEFVSALENSDIQIYWPFSENWDGKEFPIITFDPLDGSETNVGYEVVQDGKGGKIIREVIVDEQMAAARPVWVVNRNDDCGYSSLELLRRQNPEWGSGGGEVIVGLDRAECAASGIRTKSDSVLRTLVLKEFTMLRNYDSWFAGASEFFVKMGSVENFTASTEAELKL